MIHTEDGCWCDDGPNREAALDRMIPGRCEIPFDPAGPTAGRYRHCVRPAGHTEPCAGQLEPIGGPCHFCGQTYDAAMCPNCWTSLDGMALADIKALFAAGAPELSIDPGETA